MSGNRLVAGKWMKALEQVTGDKANHTPDLGGSATTAKVTDAVIDAIRDGAQRR